MKKLNTSDYVNDKFIEFLKNKEIQNTINDIIVFLNVTSVDDMTEICFTMFLANIEINKLSETDLGVIRDEIKNIRSVPIHYRQKDFDSDVYKGVPNPTDEFIKNTIKEKVDAGYRKYI
jgi:hypothetical protein